jgi:hypothetical protein
LIWDLSVFLIYALMAINFPIELPLLCSIHSDRLCFHLHWILGHKASLNKYKKLEITLCILSDHDAIKLEFNNKRNSKNTQTTGGLNNMFLHDQWVIEKLGRKSKSSWNSMRIKAQPQFNLSEK